MPAVERVLRAARDLEEHLDIVPVSPLSREMRARLNAYKAVINGWRHRPPTDGQMRTMMDLLGELSDRVRLRRPSGTRPPPAPPKR